MTVCIHIFGASGSGATTLGKALSVELQVPVFDGDDFYFDTKYSAKREPARRNVDLFGTLSKHQDWILSGSVDGWESDVPALFTHLIFLQLEKESRMKRLLDREGDRLGAEAIAPGGWAYQDSSYFLEWASHYDDGSREGRSLPRHEAWIKAQTQPLLRLNSEPSIQQLVDASLSFIQG